MTCKVSEILKGPDCSNISKGLQLAKDVIQELKY